MPEKFLRLPEVQERVGLSRSTIYEYIKQKKFPASICLGARAKGFVESEIEEWIQSQIAKSRDMAA